MMLCVPGCGIVILMVALLIYLGMHAWREAVEDFELRCETQAWELWQMEGAIDCWGIVEAEGDEDEDEEEEGEGGGDLDDEVCEGDWGHFCVGGGKEIVWCERRGFWFGREVEGFGLGSRVYVVGAMGLLVIGFAVMMSISLVRCFVLSERERIDLMRMVVHDLASPLVGIRMLVGKDDATVRNLNEQALRMVENFREFVRQTVRRCWARLERVDMMEVYEEAYQIFREDYRDYSGGDIEVKVEEGEEYGVWADEVMASQIVWNVLGNDLKYAAPYGKVRVEFTHEGKYVVVRFVDEGPGMKEEDMRHAFERYYRSRAAEEAHVSGYGIGLATGREFARVMGGELSVCANKPHGCIFELRLPRTIIKKEEAKRLAQTIRNMV